jgi:Rrf2 family iron-sulfur cluster assembly transcriptional regulator
MRLSTKGRYAVMAMTDLALNASDKPIALADIAERQQISLSYLEQLFARLRRAGLVRSARGPGGGYRLAKADDKTYVAEIVLAVDEPIRATRCASHGSPKGCMGGGERCLTHYLWEDLGAAIHDYLADVSLRDVITRRRRPVAEPVLGPQAIYGAAE